MFDYYVHLWVQTRQRTLSTFLQYQRINGNSRRITRRSKKMAVSKGEEEEKAAIGDEIVCVNIQVGTTLFVLHGSEPDYHLVGDRWE